MRIGLFGGSFNPVHNGHVRLTREFRERLALDKIIIIPANIAPHKTDAAFAGARERLDMCALAFTEDFYEISETEIGRGGTSFSFDTVREMRERYPGDELFLLVGSDMLFYFDKWVRYEEILGMCTLCAAARANDDDYAAMRAFAGDVLHDRGDRVIIMDAEPFEVSSTRIRGMVSGGEDIGGYVPQSVKDYIESRGLYIE